MSEFLDLDKILNPLDSLETVVDLLSNEKPKWKFAVIAFDNAIYNFAVANLATSNYKEVTNFYSDDDIGWKYSSDGKTFVSKKNFIDNKIGSYFIHWEETFQEIEENAVHESPLKEYMQHTKEKLIGFWTAIARVCDGNLWMGRYTSSKPLKLNDSQWESLGIIHQLRNEFIHFIPMGVSIEIDFIKKHLKNLIEPLKFLALSTGQILYVEKKDRVKVEAAINKINKLL
ncbi:MAG TPA: hypothetical protein PLG90_01020 [Ignavibacteria bacterium]|nr:hypothetical protein [Ignavibacteria bacterium]